MKDRKAKPALKVVHRHDRAQIKRVLAGSGQALLPMLELFVIDDSPALCCAIDEMFGQRAQVQRCRTHKLRNVLDRLPKTEAAQTKAVMMAAYSERPAVPPCLQGLGA